MCANVGVDPLASNKGMWTQLLGFGDFYYELGVQIVEACLSTRPYNGGLMDLDSLRSFITVRSPPASYPSPTPFPAPLLSALCALTPCHVHWRSRGVTWCTLCAACADSLPCALEVTWSRWWSRGVV